MNLLTRLIARVAFLIASLSFAWIALTLTGTIPGHRITVVHEGYAKLELTSGDFGYPSLKHEGGIGH